MSLLLDKIEPTQKRGEDQQWSAQNTAAVILPDKVRSVLDE
jgi:hypothetical protein